LQSKLYNVTKRILSQKSKHYTKLAYKFEIYSLLCYSGELILKEIHIHDDNVDFSLDFEIKSLGTVQGLVVGKPISANLGLNIVQGF